MAQFAYGLLLPSQVVAGSSANSSPFAYGTVAGANTYHLARGNSGWTGSAAAKLAALIRGSAYIDAVYGSRFCGRPVSAFSQFLAWPRSGAVVRCEAVPEALTPNPIIWAAYEAALVELRTPGALNASLNPGKRVKRQKVDNIEREFFDGGSDLASNTPVFSTIEGYLGPFLCSDFVFPAIMVV